MVAAGVLWMLVAIAWQSNGVDGVGELLRHNLLEYSELLLFLLAAMTFVNTLADRNVFAALRSWLIERGWSLRTIFWVTGAMAFVLSPVLDNLTTALVMGAVVMSSGRGNPALIAPACVNIVVAANAGGAFSPFGDITTLMVWQNGLLGFVEFFALFVPSLVNWLVPALCMRFAIPAHPARAHDEHSEIKTGGIAVIVLFALTIAMTVALHQYPHLPPFLGMMTGLGVLQIHGFFVRRAELRLARAAPMSAAPPGFKPADKPFDVFISLKRRRVGHVAVFLRCRPVRWGARRLRLPGRVVPSSPMRL